MLLKQNVYIEANPTLMSDLAKVEPLDARYGVYGVSGPLLLVQPRDQ